MTINLRELAESDLGHTVEGEFSLPVFLTSPDGVTYETNNENQPLVGQVVYDQVLINPDTGQSFSVRNPAVTLRQSTLTRIPLPGEKWLVEVPETPSQTANKKQYLMGSTRNPQDGASIGFITLYLEDAEQV